MTQQYWRVLLVILATGVVSAQTTGPTAPTDRAMDFPATTLEAVARDIAAKGLITQRVLDGGTYSVNVRHISGSETALQHGRITEVWVVRDGAGTVATGGALVEPKPGSGPGELSGTSIRGGVERLIKAGDVIFIPPGVPHGIKQSAGITYLNIRFEAR